MENPELKRMSLDTCTFWQRTFQLDKQYPRSPPRAHETPQTLRLSTAFPYPFTSDDPWTQPGVLQRPRGHLASLGIQTPSWRVERSDPKKEAWQPHTCMDSFISKYSSSQHSVPGMGETTENKQSWLLMSHFWTKHTHN